MGIENKLNEVRIAIDNSKKPIMFFDTDTDGSTSYLQLKNRFPKLLGYPLNKNLEKQKRLFENVVNYDCDLVVIFDLPYLEDELLNLVSDKDIVWVDHHPTNDKNLIKKYEILHFNPLDFDVNDNRPACYWAYKIAEMKDNLWYVALGSVADFFLLEVLIEFYEYDKFKFNVLFNLDDLRRDEIFDFIKKYNFNDKHVTDERAEIIQELTYGCGISEMKNLFDFLCRLDKYKEILRGFRLIEKMDLIDIKSEMSAGKGFLFEDYADMNAKYKKLFKKALSKGEKDFYLFEYMGKTSFTKTLSEELIYNFKNAKVVAVAFRKKAFEKYTMSFRSRGIVINDIIENVISDLEGRGGGHPLACGVNIAKNDYEIFLKRFKLELEKN